MAHRSQTFLLVLSLLTIVGCHRGPAHCRVCDRDECKGLVFRIKMPAGQTVETCCPRCGLHFLASNSTAQGAEATDFATGQWLDASKASYVSGSDVKACAMPETRRDAQGCCAFKGYDRCLPSLIAFANTTNAQAFARQHGGTIQTWPELLRR